jgi:hypothetical protein
MSSFLVLCDVFVWTSSLPCIDVLWIYWIVSMNNTKKTNSVALSPQANYTD